MSDSHFINGQWIQGAGPAFSSHEPVTGEVVWTGNAATGDEVDRAVQAARAALPAWSGLSVEQRAAYLQSFAQNLRDRKMRLTDAIARETGKPRWESATEVDAMINKVALSIDAQATRRKESQSENAGVQSATRFKPHGAVAVLGPFNFPGHLPNGHIVPALLAGNTVVFKPSELTPLVAREMIEAWHAADLSAGVINPGVIDRGVINPGVINLVQGARETGAALISHAGIDGVFFTGSYAVGCAINRALVDHPGKITALEMGGNNPLIVHDVGDLTAAAYATIQSAFITAGQRCSCARRLIVMDDANGRAFVDRLIAMTQTLIVCANTQSPEPFMGPVISESAATNLLNAQSDLQQRGGRSILPMRALNSNGRHTLLSPGIIDVTPIAQRDDRELFGPILQLIRVKDFDAAMIEANHTRFGLAAGLLSDDRALFERFYRASRAGVVNFNRPLTGASSALPFGGVGDSGNHRPSAYFAADYCSYPIAVMESPRVQLPKTLAPGITL